MSQNYIAPGKVLTLNAPYARSAGEGLKVGKIFGVACDDVLISVDVECDTEGIHELAKTSAQAWAVGDPIYWDNGNKRCDTDSAVGMLIGYCTEVAANPSAVGRVKLNGSAADATEGAQAAVVTLTDSTGLSGTHDDTLAATAALVALTDNTGDSGTHDDTLADGKVATATAALTTSALGDLVATQNTGWGASTEAGFDSIATKFDQMVTDVTALKGKIDDCVTDLGVQNQNDSDLAQKVNELAAQIAVTNQNVSDIGQKVIEILNRLVAFGAIDA